MSTNPHADAARRALSAPEIAQVHATLAVAYAQDTANLIEFFRLIENTLTEASVNDLVETISERMPFSFYTTTREDT